MAEKCIVIGNGCAAMECVKAARESGYAGEFFVMSDSSLPSYNPMLITYYASGKIGYDGLFPYGDSFDFYDRYDAERCFGSPVVSLDTEQRIVTNADGLAAEYGKCVIATGAAPVLPGAYLGAKDSMLTLRTVEDAARFKELLGSGKKRVLVAGASLTGVKAVEALVDAGFDVCLTDIAKNIFPMSSHENCSAIIHKILEEKNVRLLFGVSAETVEKDGDTFKVKFSGADSPDIYDHIIVCVGVRPNISFVDPGQIKTDAGILVDGHMETSAEGVYAVGDVCQGRDIQSGDARVFALWSNARLQGRTAGRNIAGRIEKYAGALPHNITHFFEQDFIGIGDTSGGDEVYEETDKAGNRYCRLVFSDKKLKGVNLLNIPEISGMLKYRLTKGLLADSALDELCDGSIAMNKLYNKYPGIESAFIEKR